MTNRTTLPARAPSASSRAPLPATMPDMAADPIVILSGRVKTLLIHFYSPETDEALEEAALDDWIEALAPIPFEHVNAACVEYLSTAPRTRGGARRRPIPADIKEIAARLAYAARPRPAPAPEPPRERCTPERAIEIMRVNGFISAVEAERRLRELGIGAVKRMPRSGEE